MNRFCRIRRQEYLIGPRRLIKSARKKSINCEPIFRPRLFKAFQSS